MALINTQIQPSKFEAIRDRIALILAMELENQFVTFGDYELDLDVWTERGEKIDNSECPAIIVSLASGDFSSQHQGSYLGEYTYNVDIYSSKMSEDEEYGSTLSTIALHKIAGVCTKIIEDPQYKTLGFQAPSISHREVSNMIIAPPDPNDAAYVAVGRLVVKVNVVEGTELLNALNFEGADTSVKLYNTNKGLLYSGSGYDPPIPSNQVQLLVNGEEFDIIDGGESFDLPVVDQDGNEVGQQIGNEFVVQVSGGAVDSVNGQTGAVVLTKADIGLGNVDNTSDVNKPVSTAQAAADTAVLNASKSYADGLVTGLLDDRGNYDASSNLFPSSGGSGVAGAILKGDLWTVNVAGTLGGVSVTSGDVVRALTDSPGQTASNWAVSENNIGYVAENQANKTSTMAGNEASTSIYLSAKGIYDWATSVFTTTSAVASQIATALSGYATQAWVTSQGYITNVISALGYTPENVANKSNSFTSSSTTTYASSKALSDGLNSVSIQTIPYKRSLQTFTGVTAERALDIIPLDVNTSDYLYRLFLWGRMSAATGTIRIRIGTYAAPIDGSVGVNSIGQQTLLGSFAMSNNNRSPFVRNINIVGGASGSAVSMVAAVLSDELQFATSTSVAIDTTTQLYMYVSVALNTTILTYTSDSLVVTKTKLT